MSPTSPVAHSQDNPFPSFPAQNPKPHAKLGSMDEAMSLMNLGSDNVAQAGPQQGRGRGHPGLPQHRGPSMGRGSQQDMQRHDSGHYEANGRGQQRPPQRMHSGGPTPPQQGFAAPSRSRTMPQNMSRPDGQRSYDAQQQWVEPGPAAGYHGPRSPTHIPPRPSTAGGMKTNSYGLPQFEQRPPMPQAPPAQQQYRYQHQQQQSHDNGGTLDHVYDDYYGKSVDRQSKAESIDMPNFDAIQEPSSRHRRGYSIENHLSPTASSPPVQNMAPAAFERPQGNGFYQQASRSRSQPDLNAQYSQGNGVFEMAGDAPEVPPMPAVHSGHSGSNGLPVGPRGRGPPSRGMTIDSVTARGTSNQGYSNQPQAFDPGYTQQPPMHRGYSDDTTYSEPPQPMMRNASPMVPGNSIRRPGTAAPAPGRMQSDPVPRRPGTSQPTNPDALPAHPSPVRPGLMQQQDPQRAASQAARPPPVRQYNTDARPTSHDSQQASSMPPQRRVSVAHPVTHDELNRLRNTFKNTPDDGATGLQLTKKLVEAANVLADEGGMADTRTRNKNREKFIFEAHKIIKKLVTGRYPDAMFYYADCYGQGLLGLQVDTKEAFRLYQSAAKAGHGASAYRTAVCCEMGAENGGGTKRDLEKAVSWYRRAAKLGDTPAMYKVGMILLKGLLGQQKNLAEAINMLKLAADRADAENPHALHELGLLYESQTGSERVIQDEAYAYQLFRQAGELGYKFSQFRLGQAYEYGLLGCPIDPRQSIAWYTRAAAQEEHQSELALSGWYLTGNQGILEQSDTEAYLWARKAACAEPPLPKALFAMGYFTEVGIGCPRSLDEAKRWYGRAAGKLSPSIIMLCGHFD
jgi:TPR repeat protein